MFEVWHPVENRKFINSINCKKIQTFPCFFVCFVCLDSHIFCVKDQNFVNLSCEMHLLKFQVTLKYK